MLHKNMPNNDMNRILFGIFFIKLPFILSTLSQNLTSLCLYIKITHLLEQFNDIYQQQYASILRLASQFSVNRHEAEDIVQEVFVKLYLQYQAGTTILYPKTWLYKVTTNMCLNTVSRKRDSISVEHASAQSVSCNDCIQTTIEENEQTIIIHTALSKLKKQERLLVVLYSEGLSYKEISEISNIKFSSVSKSLSRALDKLKPLLNIHNHELPNK